MKKLLPILFFGAFAALAICVSVNITPEPPEPPPPETNAPNSLVFTNFPLEVVGPQDTTASFALFVTNGSTAQSLYLRVFNLCTNKMAVRINSGSWLNLDNNNTLWSNNVDIAMFRMSTLGVQGPNNFALSSPRFYVPIGSFGTPVDGLNTFEFRFNGRTNTGATNEFSIGYKIIDLNLLHNGTNLIGSVQKPFDDPTIWTAPAGGDAAAGSNYFFNATITERGETLRSKCTDCHFRDGADLKYFNFSNRSITNRVIFHGGTLQEGLNVAAYIRGLTNTVVTNLWPWDPPYQPAPGLDAQHVYYWMAGGRLSSMLDNDLTTLDYIFGNPILTNSVNLTNVIKAREIPLAMPLPTIMTWWPKRGPPDCFVLDQDMRTNIYYLQYGIIRSNLLTKPTKAAQAQYLDGQENVWDGYGQYIPAVPADNDPTYTAWSLDRESVQHFRITKTLELMFQFDLQEQGAAVFGTNYWVNTRTWFHGPVFSTSPHKLNTRNNYTENGQLLKYPTFSVESAMWYQLQLILNDSNRSNPSIVPIDWSYQHALLLGAWNNDINYPWYGAECLNILKAMETCVNGTPLSSALSWRPGKEQIKWCEFPPELNPQLNMVPLLTRQQSCAALTLAYTKAGEWFPRSDWTNAFNTSQLNFISNQFTYYGPRMFNQGGMSTNSGMSNIVQRFVNLGAYLFP